MMNNELQKQEQKMPSNNYSTETLTVLVKESDKKISQIDNRLQRVDKKVDIKFDSMNSKFDNVSNKIDAHNKKLDDFIFKLSDKTNSNEKNIAVLDSRTNIQEEDIKELIENSKTYNEVHKKYEISSAAIKKIIAAVSVLGGIATILTAIL